MLEKRVACYIAHVGWEERIRVTGTDCCAKARIVVDQPAIEGDLERIAKTTTRTNVNPARSSTPSTTEIPNWKSS